MRFKRRTVCPASNCVDDWEIVNKENTVANLLVTGNKDGVPVRGITIYYDDGIFVEYARDTDREKAIERIQQLIKNDLRPGKPTPIFAVAREMSIISDRLKGAFS